MDPPAISNSTHPEGPPPAAVGKPEPDSSPLEPLQLKEINQASYPQLLDHTLGVVFSCFNNQQTEPFRLSSDQLNWATKFIEGHQATGQSPDLKHLTNYLQQISIALNTEELFRTAAGTDSKDNAAEQPTESSSVYDSTLDNLEKWRTEQLTALDRDYETLLTIEHLLLDWDLEDDQ